MRTAAPLLVLVVACPLLAKEPQAHRGLAYVEPKNERQTLDVYAPTSGARIATLPAAPGHWNSPIVVGGRIILPVGNYHSGAGGGRIYIWQR